jgi:elongation factor Ts
MIAKEREILTHQAKETGKPDNVIEKIVDGKINKYFSEVCLLDQPFVKNPDTTVEKRIQETVGKLGENIVVKRFCRYLLGE